MGCVPVQISTLKVAALAFPLDAVAAHSGHSHPILLHVNLFCCDVSGDHPLACCVTCFLYLAEFPGSRNGVQGPVSSAATGTVQAAAGNTTTAADSNMQDAATVGGSGAGTALASADQEDTRAALVSRLTGSAAGKVTG